MIPRTSSHHSAIHSVLDGFRLLHKTQVKNPSDVYRVDISGQHLDKVVKDHLLLFTNLYSLIANENELDLLDLSFLPQLRELRIIHNKITTLSPQVAFQMPLLTVLDISFNHLAQESIAVLAALPNLRTLDLSFCELTSISSEIANMNAWWCQFDEDIDKAMVLPGFLKLESLNLSNNRLRDGALVLSILRCLPNLVKLELQNNHIESLAIMQYTASSAKSSGFPNLEELDVSNNAICSPEGIMGVAWLPRLKRVFIAGNPITLKEESDIEINDMESGEILGHIAFNPFSILQDLYGIEVKDAPAGRKKMVTVPAGPYTVKNESERMSGIKKYALKDEDIVRMLDRRNSGSIESVGNDMPVLNIESLIDQQEGHVSYELQATEPDFEGTFITSVPLLESQQTSIDKIRERIPLPVIDLALAPLTHDDLTLSLPNTIPASVKALRLALETPASFWRLSRYTKSVEEYQELMRRIKEDKKQNIKIDMTGSNHKWSNVDNESLHKLMQAIDDKLAVIDGRMESYRRG